jgi:hypothetical protein
MQPEPPLRPRKINASGTRRGEVGKFADLIGVFPIPRRETIPPVSRRHGAFIPTATRHRHTGSPIPYPVYFR